MWGFLGRGVGMSGRRLRLCGTGIAGSVSSSVGIMGVSIVVNERVCCAGRESTARG